MVWAIKMVSHAFVKDFINQSRLTGAAYTGDNREYA